MRNRLAMKWYGTNWIMNLEYLINYCPNILFDSLNNDWEVIDIFI